MSPRLIHVFCETARRVLVHYWGYIEITDDLVDMGAMVLVTFAKTKVTGPPGPVPATTSRETANYRVRSIATF